MDDAVADLKRYLAQSAESVCRRYLSRGRREGRYWLVGDIDNSPGRSLYVRLRGPSSGPGAAGRWTDAATGEHGDLLDLIAASQGLRAFSEVLSEARRFLAMPEAATATQAPRVAPAPVGSGEAARRLWAASRPIAGTLAEAYLRRRGLTDFGQLTALRFHPRCFYRPEAGEPSTRDAWPAMIAAVTDLDGRITGVHRTWLDPRGPRGHGPHGPGPKDHRPKAPVATPRRAMGELAGHAVRFGTARAAPPEAGVLAVGEGIETVLSLRVVAPKLASAAALSAAHLAALALPAGLRRLYLVQDNDPAGRRAVLALSDRATSAGVQPIVIVPRLGDLNEDLGKLGPEALAAHVRVQLAPEDAVRFWRTPPGGARARAAPLP